MVDHEAYRRVFDRFERRKVAHYDKQKIAALLADAVALRSRSPDPEPPRAA